MVIKILGTIGKIKSKTLGHANRSGILVDGKILLDLGEKEFLNYNPKLILITHFHPDHAFFIKKKKNSLSSRVPFNIPVFAPEKSDIIGIIKTLSVPIKKYGYLITPIPTVHSLNLKSQGYLIQKEMKRIFYSSDMYKIKKSFYPMIGKLDAIITEASFIKKGGLIQRDKYGRKYGHAGIPELVDFFKKFTHRIILTHFGTWFVKNTIKAECKIKELEENDFKIEIARDGMEFKI